MDDRRRDYESDRRDYDRGRDDCSYQQDRRSDRRRNSKSDRKRSRQRRRYFDNASHRGQDYRNKEAEYYRRRSRSLTRNHRSGTYRSDRRRSRSIRSRSRSRSRSRDDRRRRYRRSRSYDDGYYRSKRYGRSYSRDRHDDDRRRRRDRRRSRSESPPSRRRQYAEEDRRSRSHSRGRHGGDNRRRDHHHQDHQQHHHNHHHHHHQLQAVVSDYSSGGEYAPEMPAAQSAPAAPAASASASAWSTVQQEASRRSSRSQNRSHGRSRRSSRKQKKSPKERRRRRRGSDRRSRSRSSSRSRSRSRSSYDDRKRSSRKSSRKQKSNRKKKKDRRSKSSSPSSSSVGDDSSDRDDTVGHFEGGPGTMVADRYRIVQDVGLGTFGRVVECVDTKQGHVDPTTGQRTDRVAIKLVRNIKRYYDSALIEADILQDVNRRGGRGLTLHSIVYDRFALPTEHYCLVFECLGPSLYDFIKKYDYRPFPLYCVRDFAQQLLEALEFLHSFQLIHTDLKPENILLCISEEAQYRDDYDGSMQMVPASTRIKIIDFGGATYDNENKSSTICTRQYRPPEVILGLHPWSMPADLWSAGCIIAELYIGELLFGTHDNAEHLALIERAVGPFPREMVSRATANGDVFNSRGLHRGRDVLSSSSYDHVRRMESIEAVVCDHDRHSGLIELLHALLVIDPNRRATAGEALSDPVDGMFFK